MPCSCGRPAQIEAGPPGRRAIYCLGCYRTLVETSYLQQQATLQQMQKLKLEMYELVGLEPTASAQPVRPVVHSGPIHQTDNSVRVHGSTIGILNTGTIGSIYEATAQMRQRSDSGIATALEQLTKAVAQSADASDADRQQIFELVATLAEKASLPESDRRPSAMRAVFDRLNQLLAPIKTMSEVWKNIQPTIAAVFGWTTGT